MSYIFENSIGKLSRQTASSIGKLISHKFKENVFDYDSRDWMYISFINNTKNINQNELANSIGFNKVMINRGIDRLVKLGIVERLKIRQDNRVNTLLLTKKGKLLYKKLKIIVEGTFKTIFKDIDNSQKQQCIEVLELILNNIETAN